MSHRYRMEAQELTAAESKGAGWIPPTPRHAAGVILVRDGASGPQVLLVRRRADVGFAAGAHVFPGGTLDEEDSDDRWQNLLVAPPPEALLGASDPGGPPALSFAVAALRETFEETGVLLTVERAPQPSRLGAEREALVSGGRSFLEIVSELGVTLAANSLVLCARWVTPESLSRRYDARFFLAEAPPGAQVSAERGELVEHLWIEPEEALHRYFAFELRMLFPTARTLDWLKDGTSVEELRRRFREVEIKPLLPRLRRVRGEVLPVLPGEPGYDEREGDG